MLYRSQVSTIPRFFAEMDINCGFPCFIAEIAEITNFPFFFSLRGTFLMLQHTYIDRSYSINRLSSNYRLSKFSYLFKSHSIRMHIVGYLSGLVEFNECLLFIPNFTITYIYREVDRKSGFSDGK